MSAKAADFKSKCAVIVGKAVDTEVNSSAAMKTQSIEATMTIQKRKPLGLTVLVASSNGAAAAEAVFSLTSAMFDWSLKAGHKQ